MKKSKRRWLNFMITICFIIFAVVLCYLIYNFNIDSQDQKQFDDMAQTITIEDNTDENADNDSGITDLINKNSDCISWIRISGTKIDYPVMQTKSNPQYYLRRDFKKLFLCNQQPPQCVTIDVCNQLDFKQFFRQFPEFLLEFGR